MKYENDLLFLFVIAMAVVFFIGYFLGGMNINVSVMEKARDKFDMVSCMADLMPETVELYVPAVDRCGNNSYCVDAVLDERYSFIKSICEVRS